MDEETHDARDNRWRITRDVPIAWVAALLIQLAGGVWWMSALASDVSEHEKKLANLSAQYLLLTGGLQDIREGQARIDERMLSLARDTNRIDDKLDRLLRGDSGPRK